MVTKILSLVFCLSQTHGVSPYIAASVVTVESNFNPKAVGPVGELGLMQLRPEYFKAADLTDVETNLKIGIKHLATIKDSCKSLKSKVESEKDQKLIWIICHNTGVTGGLRLKAPLDHAYFKKIKSTYNGYKAQRLFEQKNYACNTR